MKHKKGQGYPPEWPETAKRIKDEANWICERCTHPHDPPNGYCLTVHHLDGLKMNLEDWNLAALCQRCHLTIQGRVKFGQDYMLPHTPWMKKHVEGYNVWAKKNGRTMLTCK